jgi:hypothetical protein
MRTTLVLDDDLLREAKHRAVSLKITLSELVNRSLRETLRREPPSSEPPFAMVTFGRASGTTHHEPEDFVAALEDEERETREGR